MQRILAAEQGQFVVRPSVQEKRRKPGAYPVPHAGFP